MIVHPLAEKPARIKERPVAYVRPGVRSVYIATEWVETIHEDGAVRGALEGLKDHVVYCNLPLSRLRKTTDARAWQAETWNLALSAMRIGDTKIRYLRGALDDSADPLGDILCFRAFCGSRGVPMASVSSMAWNLWRSTLPRAVMAESDPEVTAGAFYGGRQQAPKPGTHRRMALFDISAAYPSAMVSEDYPVRLREVAGPVELYPEPGIARARVSVPPELSLYPPLPLRPPETKGTVMENVVIYPPDEAEGTWSLRELWAAAELGCEVTVERAWMPDGRYVDPFGPWWKLMRSARRLPGGAGALGKLMSNALWSQFTMSGSRSVWTWPDAGGEDRAVCVRSEPERKLPHLKMRHWALDTSARVRTKLLTEGIYGTTGRPVHVDTDGVILRGSSPGPPGRGWRRVREMATVDVRGPQLYRWTCGHGCGITHPRWHFCCSGIPADEQRGFWEREVGERVFVVSSELTAAGVPLRSPSTMELRRRKMAHEAAMVAGILEPRRMFLPEEEGCEMEELQA